jgi:hypothetical protein
VANERPDGVGRNTSRGTGTKSLDLTLTYGFGFGHRAMPPPRAAGSGTCSTAWRRPVPRSLRDLRSGGNIFSTVNFRTTAVS